MKKILFITPDFFPNSTGFANACLNLIEAINKFSDGKYEVHVFTDCELGNSPEIANIKVLRYKPKLKINRLKYLLNDIEKINAVDKYVKTNEIDIIFFETNTFAFFEYSILKKHKDKCIVRIHSTADTEVPVFTQYKTLGSKLVKKEMFKFMREIPYIISTSNYYIDFIMKYYLEENVYSKWQGKSYGILHNTSSPIDVNIDTITGNTFLTMGKMSENGLVQKGITDLLKSVYILKLRNQLPKDFNLIIVGTGTKISYLRYKINKLQLDDICTIIETATHEEVFELIKKSKAIVLLSRYEGQSMFITESISMGKPIVITKDNGMEDMLVDGINGFSVRVGDIEQAANALKTMIELDSNKLCEMGKNSKKIYEEKFSPKKVYEQFDILMTLKD